MTDFNLAQIPRKIIHIDMDCFYAAIEIRDQPELANRPVAVGGTAAKHGVLCTCNYVARKFGLHSAMPTASALRLCPDLVLLPVNFSKYKIVSQHLHEIFRRFTQLVEPLALDEAYLDVTNSHHENGSATLIAEKIRQTIWQELQLSSSAGVANNKFLAKIASGWNKPNGICVILPNQVAEFIAQLAVSKLFGVGKVTAHKLQQRGIQNCADLQQLTQFELIKQFGKLGNTLYWQARGIDNRAVIPNRPRKSLSVERTFERAVQTPQELAIELTTLHNELLNRLANSAISRPIKTQFIKLKLSNWQQASREMASTSPELLNYQQLLANLWHNESISIRLLGIGVSFAPPELELIPQPELFFTA